MIIKKINKNELSVVDIRRFRLVRVDGSTAWKII